MKVSLQYPIAGASGTIAEVEVRRLKGKDMLELDKWQKEGLGDGETSLRMLAMLTGLEFDAVLELDGDDIAAISGVIENFSKKAKTTNAG